MVSSKLFIIVLSFYVITSATLVLAQIPNQNSDAQVLGLITVIDQGEVQVAQLALRKNIDPEVLNYARMLNKEHNEHLILTQKFSQQIGMTIVDNTPSINQVRNKNEEDVVALTRLNGDDFAQLYIADMIKGHLDVLNWIESQESETKDEQIRDFLKDAQKHVAIHLQMAQELQKHQSIGPTQ